MNANDARNFWDRSTEAQFSFPDFKTFLAYLNGKTFSRTANPRSNNQQKASHDQHCIPTR